MLCPAFWCGFRDQTQALRLTFSQPTPFLCIFYFSQVVFILDTFYIGKRMLGHLLRHVTDWHLLCTELGCIEHATSHTCMAVSRSFSQGNSCKLYFVSFPSQKIIYGVWILVSTALLGMFCLYNWNMILTRWWWELSSMITLSEDQFLCPTIRC